MTLGGGKAVINLASSREGGGPVAEIAVTVAPAYLFTLYEAVMEVEPTPRYANSTKYDPVTGFNCGMTTC